MKYTITLYSDGKMRSKEEFTQLPLYTVLNVAANALYYGDVEYEITNERGDVVAYAYTEDSPRAIEKANDYAADMKEARADMAGEFQREELASRKHCGAGKS